MINKNFKEKLEINILDFFCSSGNMLSLIQGLSNKKIFSNKKISLFGVDVFNDISDLINARKLAKKANIKSVTPYERFDFDLIFDVVISNQVFDHINNVDKIYAYLSFF